MFKHIIRLTTKALSRRRTMTGNVIMFHLGRSGSTVVGNLLQQHPRIFWANELYLPIFREWQASAGGLEVAGEMPEDAMTYLKNQLPSDPDHCFGFEMKPFHFRLIGYSQEDFLRSVGALGFNRFILLDRRNRLRKVISSVIAHEDPASYHIKSTDRAQLRRVWINPANVRIDFDAKPLVTYLSEYDRQVRRLEKCLRGRQLLRLTYEDDVQTDPRRAYKHICTFLGLTPTEPFVNLARTNPFSMSEMVENYDEVKMSLSGTRYEWMLYD